jgi:hypothetical protein
METFVAAVDQDKQEAYVGLNGFTYKIGRAIPLRTRAGALGALVPPR